jgi:hypothetical protein
MFGKLKVILVRRKHTMVQLRNSLFILDQMEYLILQRFPVIDFWRGNHGNTLIPQTSFVASRIDGIKIIRGVLRYDPILGGGHGTVKAAMTCLCPQVGYRGTNLKVPDRESP